MNADVIASLTTAAGTLVLAVATPVLMNAQLGDPRQKIGFADQHWTLDTHNPLRF